MSRKHFVALAESFSKIQDLNARRQAADAVIAVAWQLNPNFDKSRFLSACGL